MLFFTKTPRLLRWIFPSIICLGPENKIYLSFDDGPQPGVTDKILDVLAAYEIKAHFFCIGQNVASYPELFARILREGHRASNHSYSHHKGWNTSAGAYIADVNKGNTAYTNNYFRPPYGQLSYRQYQMLKKTYRIVLWDVLSGDFHSRVSAAQCLQNVLRHLQPGSIVVYHDKLISAHKVLHNLPLLIDHCRRRNWEFGLLP